MCIFSVCVVVFVVCFILFPLFQYTFFKCPKVCVQPNVTRRWEENIFTQQAASVFGIIHTAGVLALFWNP